MDEQVWLKESFIEGKKAPWPCPVCKQKALFSNNDSEIRIETLQSKFDRTKKNWQESMIYYDYSGTLVCKSCSTFILNTGTAKFNKSAIYDTEKSEFIVIPI